MLHPERDCPLIVRKANRSRTAIVPNARLTTRKLHFPRSGEWECVVAAAAEKEVVGTVEFPPAPGMGSIIVDETRRFR